MSATIQARGVAAGHGDRELFSGLDLVVAPGDVVGLVGPNGAGKTTVARVCSGLVRPTSGRLLVDDDDMTGRPARELARRGIAHAPEGRSVFSSLTIEENLELSFRASLGRRRVDASVASVLAPEVLAATGALPDLVAEAERLGLPLRTNAAGERSYHPLFRSFLLERLAELRDAGERAELHARVAPAVATRNV